MNLKKELIEWIGDKKKLSAILTRNGEEIKAKDYQSFACDIVAFARRFENMPEKQIALMGENSYLWFLCFYGGVIAGKNMVLVDMLLPISELETVISNINVERVVLSPELAELKSSIEEFNGSCACMMWDEFSLCENREDSIKWLDERKNFDDGYIMALTSGTTGKAKAVMLKTEAFLYNNYHLAECLEGEVGERVYSSLPMHHMYGINKTFAFFHKGLEVCLGSMRTVSKDLKVYEPKYVLTVPTVVEFLDKKKAFVPSVKTVIVSGCKCEKRVQFLCEAHGIFLQNIYGSSETAGGMALNMNGDDVDVLSIIPGREVLIEDGEIVIRSEGRMTGYYNNADETREKMHDGCIYTGDMGYLDDDGKLHINGRKKDMISMVNGDKLYCEETDEILCGLPYVEEAAVLYVDRKLIAVILPKKGVTSKEVMSSIEQYNNNQQMIRRMNDVWIVNRPLPRTTTGKLQRMALEKMYCDYLNGI